MALIGNIALAANVNLNPLIKGLKKGDKALSGFASRVTRGMASIANFGGGGVGAWVALVSTQLKDMANSAVSNIGATRGLAVKLGTTTEELVGLRHQAALAGIEVDTLGNVLQKMQINLAKSAQGLKKVDEQGVGVASTIKRLGINAKEAVTKGAITNFKAVADGISAIQDPARRTAAAVAVFGKQGTAVAGLLAKGSKGVDDAIAESKRFGLSFSMGQADIVKNATVARRKLNSAWAGIGNQLVIAVAPLAEGFATALTDCWVMMLDFATKGMELWRWFTDGTLEFLKGWGIDIAGIVEGIGIVFRNLPDFLEIAYIKIQGLLNNIGEFFGTTFINAMNIAEWFGRNWQMVILNAIHIVIRGFIDLGTNIGELAYSIYTFLKDPTGGFHVNWTPILEGFEPVIEALPEMVKTELTSVQGQVDAVTARISKREVERTAKAVKDIKDAAAKAPDAKPKKLFAEAVEFGSAEAFKNVLEFKGVGSGDAMTDVAKNTGDSLEIQKAMLAAPERQEMATGDDDFGAEPF